MNRQRSRLIFNPQRNFSWLVVSIHLGISRQNMKAAVQYLLCGVFESVGVFWKQQIFTLESVQKIRVQIWVGLCEY